VSFKCRIWMPGGSRLKVARLHTAASVATIAETAAKATVLRRLASA